MGLREDFAEYTDKDGLLQPWTDRSSGNGLLYTSEMFILLVKLGMARQKDYDHYFSILKSCEVVPGLYHRSPDNKDQQGPDDYVGITAAGLLLGTVVPKWVLDYGRDNDWVWNNLYPGTLRDRDGGYHMSPWLGRQLSFLCHLFFAAKERPTLLLRLSWAVAVIRAAYRKREDQDAKILSWLLVETFEACGIQSTICTVAAAIFKLGLKRQFPDGISQVLSEYFQNPAHPLVRYWPKES